MEEQDKTTIEEEVTKSGKEKGDAIVREEVTVTKKDRFLPVSILVAAAVVGGAIVFSTLYKGGGTGSGAGNGQAGTAPSAAANADISKPLPTDTILGNQNAPVTLVEYGDYQCPFCGKFFADTESQIVKNYVNTGKVRMIFRNLAFLGQESTKAAEAAYCAKDQNQFWAYHNALYTAKVADASNGENDGFFSRAEFIKLAQGISGMNVTAFTSCIDSGKYASQVSKDNAAAQAAGVQSTPTIYINGKQILGAQPYATFQAAIDAALKG